MECRFRFLILIFAVALRCDAADLDSRVVKWPGVLNARDLGGMSGLDGRMVKKNLIYRSAGLNGNACSQIVTNGMVIVTNAIPGITLLDKEGQKAILAETGIRTDLDLRRRDETAGMTGSPLGDGVVWTNIPSLHYDRLFSHAGRIAFAGDFRVFCNETNYPIVFHCISGADRTGTLAATLLALLGASETDIRADWEMTLQIDERDLLPIGGNLGACRPERFQSLVDGFAHYHGSDLAGQAESFALSCGIGMDEIEQFRAIMLERLPQEANKSTDGLCYIDSLIGTEGKGSQYGGMMPYCGVSFGSFQLVPMTRLNRVGQQLRCGAADGVEVQDDEILKSSSWYVGAEIASAYLGSSGAIYDTNPIASQEVGWLFDFGEYGWIDGYFWIVSSLHDRQHESHRMLFSEFETVIRYGQSWRVAENAVLKASAGPLWNPAIGYKGAHRNTWGPYVTAYLDNPVVVPYMSGLWILSPKMRGRIRFGVRRTFTLSEHFDLTPSVETVWMDRRRFDSRYGAEPEDSFLGGSFTTVTIGVKLSWQITENWQSYFRFQMFDVINSQARRAVKKQDAYYAKCDWPIFKLGVEYSF